MQYKAIKQKTLSKFLFWYNKQGSTKIKVDCLLPNGICITFPLIRSDTTITEIKNNLWQEAKNYALFELLKPKDQYVFEVVSSKGGTEELLDENLTLFHYQPVRPYLKVVQKIGDESEKLLKSRINMLIGRNITSQQNISTKNEEVDNFREVYHKFTTTVSYKRGRSTWNRRAIYTYPPDYMNDEAPISLKAKLVFTEWNITTVIHGVIPDKTTNFVVFFKTLPNDLIKLALEKGEIFENPQEYVLKIFGRTAYLLGKIVMQESYEHYEEIELIQYRYVRDCLTWNKPIELQLEKRCYMNVERIVAPKSIRRNKQQTAIRLKKTVSIWKLNPKTPYKIKIVCALDVQLPNMLKYVVCGIYHGAKELCAKQQTTLRSETNPQWNEFLEFNISVTDLPRKAKLCLAIVGHQKGADIVVLAWANIHVMDFKGNLKTGLLRLCCWPSFGEIKREGDVALLNPLGTVAVSGNENGPYILIEPMRFAKPVSYPSQDEIQNLAIRCTKQHNVQKLPLNEEEQELLESIILKDPLVVLQEEEMKILWKQRFVCCVEYPESLPKLLQALEWNKKEQVAQMYYLLDNWHVDEVKLEVALDLLDYRFPDDKVRQLAVKILDTLSDNELELYLLQLTQVLKYEAYLDSALARFLLKRALNNRRIGHYLFWHLKAEISTPECSLQFGLLLEMYCRGSVSHMDILLKQVEAINKLKTISEILQSYKDSDKQKKIMHELFRQEGYTKAFCNWISPLDPSIGLKELKVEKCKFMDSAKKPLWLVFENQDKGAEDVCIIFKNGDDLRQDMLTLLSLRIMENTWQKAGLDYGLVPYRCLSTGPMVGLIEVVKNAETLAKIQTLKGKLGVLNEAALYNWMQEKHKDEDLKWCVNNFTRSVVGYSIATFVLGIADRHNDNVMMKEDTAQLFHIDFGHFLGNWKTKFGIKRERVAFVLPDEFIYIIQRADPNKNEKENFEKFKEMCMKAFLVLRENGNLFITLFAMLLSTGIPELRQPSDLDFLRKSFALEQDENDSVEHFERNFKEAYEKRKTTSLMWMIHVAVHYWK